LAWEKQGPRAYYYRSERVGDTVRRVYVGTGEAARRAAAEDAAAKAKRQADQAELARFQATLAGPSRVHEEAGHQLRVVTEAALLVLGCYQHHGQWRHRSG
jgi:hypothetical protein